jgi:hypothetical protein
MLQAALTLILLAPLAACSIAHSPGSEQSPTDYMYAYAEPRDVSLVAVEAGVVTVAFAGSIPNPCYSFDRVEVTREGSVYDVLVRARVPTDTICIQVIGELERELEVPVDASGTVTLRFSPEHELEVTLP